MQKLSPEYTLRFARYIDTLLALEILPEKTTSHTTGYILARFAPGWLSWLSETRTGLLRGPLAGNQHAECPSNPERGRWPQCCYPGPGENEPMSSSWLPDNHRVWNPVAERLVRSFITYDVRGPANRHSGDTSDYRRRHSPGLACVTGWVIPDRPFILLDTIGAHPELGIHHRGRLQARIKTFTSMPAPR